MSKRKYKTSATKQKVKREPNVRFRAFLSSLINNRAAFESARKEKWWAAAILFLASVLIATVPTPIQSSKIKGGDIYSSSLYHTDVGLRKFGDALVEEDVDITVAEVNGRHQFVAPDFTKITDGKVFTLKNNTAGADVEIPYFSYAAPRQVGTTTQDFEYLRVYYVNDDSSFYTERYTVNTEQYLATTLYNLSVATDKSNITSHYIIGRDSIYIRLYNPKEIIDAANDTVPVVMERVGYVSALPLNLNIRDFTLKDMSGNQISDTDFGYAAKHIENWENLINISFIPVRNQELWRTTAFNLIIFTAISLIMGVIVFITTRGKNNPNRDLKFGESFKVAMWLLPSPALITLIVGFFVPLQWVQTIYVMTLGLRSVWLTMRTLNPYVAE